MKLTVFESGPLGAPTLLFLHGLGVSSWMWEEQINALNERYHCLAVDLPGSGDSYQMKWRSLADTADQLAALVRDKGSGGQAHVIGLSLGGYTTLTLLARHPDVVRSALVSGVTPRPFDRPRLFAALGRVMAHANRWPPFVKLMARMMQLPPEAHPLFMRDNQRLSTDTFTKIYDEVVHFSLPDRWPDGIPLLAVAGEKEARLIVDGLTRFAEQPATVTAVASAAHHGWNGEFPQLFTDMIAAWIEQRPLPDELIVQTPSRPLQFETA